MALVLSASSLRVIQFTFTSHLHLFRFTLESENKGWESIVYYDGKNGERFLLGLCESEYI